jgi:hypothetical protein
MDGKYIGDASLTVHGTDWCQWIVVNLERACDPLDMYDRMVEKVWNQDQAIAALDAGMTYDINTGDYFVQGVAVFTR